jgi:homoserine O-acetyltransferase
VARQSITADPHFHNGRYLRARHLPEEADVILARMVGHITYLSDTRCATNSARPRPEKRHQQLRATFGKLMLDADFQVESYLHYQGETFLGAISTPTPIC